MRMEKVLHPWAESLIGAQSSHQLRNDVVSLGWLTAEASPWRFGRCPSPLMRAGLLNSVTLLGGEASATVRTLEGPFDCVFFDADRISAPEQLEILIPKLKPDVLLLADNVLSHPEEIADYLNFVAGLVGFSSVTIPIGKGLNIAYRQSP